MSIYTSTKISPYVYWLTHKTTGQFYIGYREANLVPSDQDLGFFYWTSSKIVEPIFSEFDIHILAEFFDGDSAWNQEQRIIEANIKNPLCLNGHYVKEGSLHFRRVGKMPVLTELQCIARSNRAFLKGFGKNKTKEHEDNLNIAIIKSNKSKNNKLIVCPHCNISGGQTNMLRYHFDNCEETNKNKNDKLLALKLYRISRDELKRSEEELKIKEMKQKILDSGIDFSKQWQNILATYLGCSRYNGKTFIKRHMTDLWSTVFI